MGEAEPVYKPLELKEKNWSLNLEDPYYKDHMDEAMAESTEAVSKTITGCYVNIVTDESCGDPREGFIAQLESELSAKQIKYQEIRYIDQCGCGGHVIRVFC
jgi:hypothetical protein